MTRKPRQAYLTPLMTGAELKQFRQALGLSQSAFAAILRVSRATIARAETMENISRILTLSLDHALRDGLLRLRRKPIRKPPKKPT